MGKKSYADMRVDGNMRVENNSASANTGETARSGFADSGTTSGDWLTTNAYGSTYLVATPQVTIYDWWTREYYPVITQSYPVYIQERARDKGKQAYEIIKVMSDKKLMKIETAKDFIEAMDELIKIL